MRYGRAYSVCMAFVFAFVILSAFSAGQANKTSDDRIEKAVNYAISELTKGVEPKEIADALIDRGYSNQEIRQVQEKANAKILEIRADLGQINKDGVDIASTRDYLREQGFTDEQIDESMRFLKERMMAAEETVSAGKTDERTSDSLLSWDLILNLIIILLLFFIIVLIFYVYWKSRRDSRREGSDEDMESELKKLTDEKKELEELISLAQKKYHKRKIDEESFREIVRDHQKKLIEVESKISKIEKRVKKLEDKS
ncbi:MAG: hypothetical protein V1921_03910 [Candidatus Altiarchaeota archaeon]